MNDLSRHVPASAGAERNLDFCVCRVLENCALVKIKSLGELAAAKRFIRHIASSAPGSYVVFSYRSKRVVSKIVSRPAA